MKHIKFTYVDAVTGISVASQPAANGPVFPNVLGLQYEWARESQYPTDVPEFFGTCPDESPTQIDGVLGVYLQADWEQMRIDEMAARDAKAAAGARITRLAFRNRFTTAERASLEIAALDDPAAAMPARMQAATLRAYLADLAAATFVDLQRPDTRSGVEMLESAGLLTEGRASEILDAPIQPEERPQ